MENSSKKDKSFLEQILENGQKDNCVLHDFFNKSRCI